MSKAGEVWLEEFKKSTTPKVFGEVCQEEGCIEKARYKLFRYNKDGTKSWVSVCKKHELKIGNDNMRRAGGRIESEDLHF